MREEGRSEEDILLETIDKLLMYRITKCGVKAARRNDEELHKWRTFAERELSTYLRLMKVHNAWLRWHGKCHRPLGGES